MKQYEEVIKVMEKNGGYATLAYLYHNVDVKNWKTKTPFASIRRIVQDKRHFFKIKPGLWALNSYRKDLTSMLPISKYDTKKDKELFDHTYYQGLVVEIGNLKGYETFIPNQDKNKRFLEDRLGDCASLENIYLFTYNEIVNRAKTIDVVWFNNVKLPDGFFEVEHSTDFQNSLLKMYDLRYFHASFNIIADSKRFKEFENKLSFSTFIDFKKRVKFISYEKLADYHSKTSMYYKLHQELKL